MVGVVQRASRCARNACNYLRMGNEGGFELSGELMSVLPSDPYDQLDLARRITAMAVSSCTSKLEMETGKLRQKLAEKEHEIHGLQERISVAQSTLIETNAKISKSMEEQVGLSLGVCHQHDPDEPLGLNS